MQEKCHLLERLSRRSADIIEVDPERLGCEDVAWTQLGQGVKLWSGVILVRM